MQGARRDQPRGAPPGDARRPGARRVVPPVEHRPPKEILAELGKLEEEIQQGMKELEGMLG
jgi:hypothetical protein